MAVTSAGSWKKDQIGDTACAVKLQALVVKLW